MERPPQVFASSNTDHSRRLSSVSPPVKIFAEEGRRMDQTVSRFGSKLHSIKSRYTEQKEKALANGKLRATRNILPFIEIPASKNSVCLSPLRKRAHGSSLDDSQASKNLIVRSKDPKYERTPPLAIGSVTIESVASSDQSRSSPVRSKMILQQTLQLFEKNLHIAVIKELFQESFIICGIDVLSGQRYELQIALDEIVNILGGIVPVNSIEEESIWLAILPKVTLRPVLKFSNLEFETERKRTIAGAQSFDAYENCHEMLPDNGEQAENACPNLPRVTRRASISSVESSTGLCNPSSSSPQHDIDQIPYRTKILNGSSLPPRSNNISFSIEKEVKSHITVQPSGRANHELDADDDTNYEYYDGATLEETCNRDAFRNEIFNSHEACDERQARVMCGANGLQLHQPTTKDNADAILPVTTAREIKKKIFLTTPPVNSKRITAKFLTVDIANGSIAHPSKGILGPGSKQRDFQKLGENKNKSELTSKTKVAYPPGPSIKQRLNILKLNTARSSISDALSQHGKVSPLKPAQSLHPLCKNDNDIHHIPVVMKDVLQDRLKSGPIINPSLRKNQCQKVSSDIELSNDKAFFKLPSTTRIHSNKGNDKESSRKGDDRMNLRLSHTGRTPTTSINHQHHLHPTVSPRCLTSVKDYKYETDGYTVDLEIFSGNPGDKLPPLLQTYQPSVSSTLELLKSKQGQNDEPCSSSRSVYRSFADGKYPIPTEQNSEQNEIKCLDIQGLQESTVIEEENILSDSTILQQKSGVTDKSHELSKDTIDIDTISNGSLDNDVFSYGSVGGWGNYVDEDVDVGDSNNFDDEELSPSELSATEGEFFPYTPQGPNVVGSQGFMSHLPHTHIAGGTYQSSGPRGEDIDLSISANTTVCLNSVGIRKLVRNLDHGIEYRNIIPGDPR